MAKWDFKIVGASFVKELVPVLGDTEPRSQSFMQPSFDLQGDKIVMKESGAYKTSISFTQISEIDGVAPTDLEDAYAKLLTLVENFNGGGGAPGTTPNLPQVLTIRDRTFQDVGSPRDFAIVDRTKYLLCFGNVVMTLNESATAFPLDSLLQFRVFEPNVSLVIAGGTLCYYLDSAISLTSINLSVGDYCELKNIALNTWILTILNKSAGGGTWGSITGILSAQTDLQNALDAKQATLTDTNFGAFANSLTAKTTPLDTDLVNIVDTSDSNKQKKVTFTNVKAFLKTYFDTIYTTVSAVATQISTAIAPATAVTFNGSTVALDNRNGTAYSPYTQVGVLNITVAGGSVVLGFATLAITANGSAISVPVGWRNVGGDSISIVNGNVNRFIITQMNTEFWYTVKVN